MVPIPCHLKTFRILIHHLAIVHNGIVQVIGSEDRIMVELMLTVAPGVVDTLTQLPLVCATPKISAYDTVPTRDFAIAY